jgi:hypothetical protein
MILTPYERGYVAAIDRHPSCNMFPHGTGECRDYDQGYEHGRADWEEAAQELAAKLRRRKGAKRQEAA